MTGGYGIVRSRDSIGHDKKGNYCSFVEVFDFSSI